MSRSTRRLGVLAHHVPGVCPAEHPNLTLLADQWLKAAAERRMLNLVRRRSSRQAGVV
jgi:hypothetical protein